MNTHKAKVKICFVTTVPFQVNVFLVKHILKLVEYVDIVIITNGNDHTICELSPELNGQIRVCFVPFQRPIRPLRDIWSLLKLIHVLYRERPSIVQSMSPKAGLLCALAGWMLNLPIRVHWFTGQVWVNRQGIARNVLKILDALIAKLNTHLLADSPSQRDFLIQNSVAHISKIEVLGSGSVCGVDVDRFQPNSTLKSAVRKSHGIPDDGVLALFVGRVTPDKGVIELAQALRILSEQGIELHCLFVGPDEGNMAIPIKMAAGNAAKRIVMTGYSGIPETFMSAADFMVLPSYREGFGSTIIEAAACGVTTIGTRIYGIIDAIQEGETGLLVEPRNPEQLAEAMRKLVIDRQYGSKLGIAARMRVLANFRSENLTEALVNYYDRLLRMANRTTHLNNTHKS